MSASEPSCSSYFARVPRRQSRSVKWSKCGSRAEQQFRASSWQRSEALLNFSWGEWRAQCGDFGNLQEIFSRIVERPNAGRQLTWSVVVVPVVDGPGRIAISLAVDGQVTVTGSCDAVLSSHGVIVDAAVAGQLGEGAHGPVWAGTGRVLGANILGSCEMIRRKFKWQFNCKVGTYRGCTHPSGSAHMIARIWLSWWAFRYGQSFLSVAWTSWRLFISCLSRSLQSGPENRVRMDCWYNNQL